MATRSASTAQTGAERQRAYRQRHKGEIKVPRAKDQPPSVRNGDEDQGESDNGDASDEVSLATLNARMRRMAMTALDDVGGVEYLKRVARKSPNTFLRFASQFVTKEDAINPGAFRIYVQKLTIEAAMPVAGVISSPIVGHIAQNQPWLAPPAQDAQVIERESSDARSGD